MSSIGALVKENIHLKFVPETTFGVWIVCADLGVFFCL